MEKPKRAITGRDSDKYIVRFPDGMRDRIAEEAKANGRSMNAEIVTRLDLTLSFPWLHQKDLARRKREMVQKYLDWCIRHRAPPHLSFVEFSEAYAAAAISGEGDIQVTQNIYEIDADFLSDLYFEWEAKNQSRHRNTDNPSPEIANKDDRSLIPQMLQICRSEDLIQELLRRFGGAIELTFKSPGITSTEDPT